MSATMTDTSSKIIPYSIERESPNGAYTDTSNIIIDYGCVEQTRLDSEFIIYIIQFMYEFCSEEYGHGIKITSYDDFCDKFHEESGSVRDIPLFKINYFEDNSWKEWNIDEHSDDIYSKYMKFYYTS